MHCISARTPPWTATAHQLCELRNLRAMHAVWPVCWWLNYNHRNGHELVPIVNQGMG